MTNKITKAYISETKEVKNNITNIIQKLNDQKINDDVYKMGILSICIKFETFTSEVFAAIFKNKKVSYNHPWTYTRAIAKKLDLDLLREYELGRSCWNFYNTLKHVNSTTKKMREKLKIKYNVKSYEEAFIWIFNALMALLNKFLI